MKITKEGFAVIEGDSHFSLWVEQSGLLDHDQSVLSRLLPFINEGDYVIESGSNIGTMTVAYAKKVGIDGIVFAFEPHDEAFECLEYNMKNYHQAILIHSALSDKIKPYKVIDCENKGASYIEDVPMSTRQTTTIDNEYDLDRCDLIAIDSEGSEVEILRGANQTIKKFHPKLYLEINEGTLQRKGYTAKDIFDFLDAHGYTYRNIYEGEKMEGLQFDIIAI